MAEEMEDAVPTKEVVPTQTQADSQPNNTIYINNLNERIKKEDIFVKS